jgi:hypothetical protein
VELPVQVDPGDMARGLRPGDRVQVLAAYTEGARRGRAVVLLPAAEVVQVLQDPAGLTASGQERGVQLRMPSDRAPIVAAAIATARIFVVKAPGPVTEEPEEIGELPESDQYVSIEVIGPGERSGQRALLSVDRFNKLASSGDMNTVLMNAVAEQQPRRPAQPRRHGRGTRTRDGQPTGRRKVEWGLPHRGRISPEEAAWVREHLDEVQQLRAERGVPLLDPADRKTKERYGL